MENKTKFRPDPEARLMDQVEKFYVIINSHITRRLPIVNGFCSYSEHNIMFEYTVLIFRNLGTVIPLAILSHRYNTEQFLFYFF
jgi:hypothetical protein